MILINKGGWYDAFINDGSRGTECDQKGWRQGGNKTFSGESWFVVGGTVTVISETDGNMIVNVKDSRVAIGKDMANKIMV